MHIPGGNELTAAWIISSIPKFHSNLPGVNELKLSMYLPGDNELK